MAFPGVCLTEQKPLISKGNIMLIKKIIFSFLAVFVAFALAACSRKGGNDDAVKLTAWVRSANNYEAPPDYVLEAVHQKILKDTGVDLKVIVGPSDAGEFYMKLNNALAAGEQIDIVQVQNIKTYYDNGVLADLTEAIKKYGSNIWERQGKENMDRVIINGNYYGVPRNSLAGNVYPVWIRGDWLKKYNLNAPTTIDEFENVLSIFAKNDPSGNGTTVPLMTDSVTNCIMTLAAAWLDYGYNDLNGQFIDSDGRLLPSILARGFKDFLATLYRWYQNGYLPSDNYLLSGADQVDIIKAGRVGAWAGWYSYITLYEGIMQENYPDAYYEKLNLQGPNGFAQSFIYSGGDWPAAYVVFSRCKDVEAAVRVLNWGYIDDNFIYSKYAMDAKVELIDGVYYYSVINDHIGNDYQGLYAGPANESKFRVKDGSPLLQLHYDYISMQMDDFRYGKFPFTKGVRFNRDLLNAACPRLSDINRMIEENLLGFLTGTRPLSRYDNFISQLYSLGFDKYIDELTRQFNEEKRR